MNTLLYGILIYLGWLFAWFCITLVTYYFSILIKRRWPLGAVVGVSVVAQWIFNLLLAVWFIYTTYSLVANHQILAALLFFFLLGGFFWMIYGMLAGAFTMVPFNYYDKLDSYLREGQHDSGMKASKKEGGDREIQGTVAKYFIAVYAIDLGGRLLLGQENFGWMDYIVTPIIFIGFWTIVAWLLVAIYNRITHKKPDPQGRAKTFITTMKVVIVIEVVSLVILYLGASNPSSI